MRGRYGECFEEERDWSVFAYDASWGMVIGEASCCSCHRLVAVVVVVVVAEHSQ